MDEKEVESADEAATFSPTQVVLNGTDASGYNVEITERIREEVKKDDWKELIRSIGASEKDFESVIPTAISSMQKSSTAKKRRKGYTG